MEHMSGTRFWQVNSPSSDVQLSGSSLEAISIAAARRLNNSYEKTWASPRSHTAIVGWNLEFPLQDGGSILVEEIIKVRCT